MNVSGKNANSTQGLNVLALFEEIVIPQNIGSEIAEDEDLDFLADEEEEEIVVASMRKVATESQFPDQSIYVLNDQLSSLKEALARIKFYLGDIDDLIPR